MGGQERETPFKLCHNMLCCNAINSIVQRYKSRKGKLSGKCLMKNCYLKLNGSKLGRFFEQTTIQEALYSLFETLCQSKRENGEMPKSWPKCVWH